jgi:hypothetical protein
MQLYSILTKALANCRGLKFSCSWISVEREYTLLLLQVKSFLRLAQERCHSWQYNAKVSGGQLPVYWVELLYISLFLRGTFRDSRDFQFLNQHPVRASINGSHEAIEHFVLNSIFAL